MLSVLSVCLVCVLSVFLCAQRVFLVCGVLVHTHVRVMSVSIVPLEAAEKFV